MYVCALVYRPSPPPECQFTEGNDVCLSRSLIPKAEDEAQHIGDPHSINMCLTDQSVGWKTLPLPVPTQFLSPKKKGASSHPAPPHHPPWRKLKQKPKLLQPVVSRSDAIVGRGEPQRGSHHSSPHRPHARGEGPACHLPELTNNSLFLQQRFMQYPLRALELSLTLTGLKRMALRHV